jgi:glycogen synthase
MLRVECKNFRSKGYNCVAYETQNLRFEVVSEVIMKAAVFWDMTAWSLVTAYRYS